jgi:hypothetical protein
MARVSSFRNDKTPSINSGVFHVQKTLAVVNGSAANGDTIDVMGIAPSQKVDLISAVLRTSASLGAGATVQLRAAGSAVTTATTAAAASKVDSNSDSDVPMSLNGGDLIDLLVGGAGITAGATITVDLMFANRE